MIVSINQPAYLPWLGYFDRIDASDLHIILDHVQFEKNSFVNRNRIRTPQGTAWLTVPLATKGRFGELAINTVEIADAGRWADKHLKAIRSNYSRCFGYAQHEEQLENLYRKAAKETLFVKPVLEANHYYAEILEIDTKTVKSSGMDIVGTKSELVLNLCREVGATTYLSGPLGRDYLDMDAFARAGIGVRFHDYQLRPYEQPWPGFEAGVAALDALLALGARDAREIMRAGRVVMDE